VQACPVVSIDVLPSVVGPDAWGEVRVALSRQHAAANRPAGIISRLYRLRCRFPVVG
jgi:hypothetical protein